MQNQKRLLTSFINKHHLLIFIIFLKSNLVDGRNKKKSLKRMGDFKLFI